MRKARWTPVKGRTPTENWREYRERQRLVAVERMRRVIPPARRS
jgi:hypothetical protein